MFNIVLFEPEIPQNTGNISRLCVNTGCSLHLIEPLGFKIDDKQLKRSGLDYWQHLNVKIHKNWQEFLNSEVTQESKLYAATTKTTVKYTDINYSLNDFLIFGPETRGLPEDIRHSSVLQPITIPMKENSRSLNLSNSVSIIVYEAWRQHEFK